MHATLHPNFQRLRPSSLHTHLRKSEPRASPSPSGFPRAAPSPPLQHRSGRQDGFQPGTAAVLFSSASPGSRSPSPGSAASGCAPDRPFSLPQPAPALARPLAPGLEVGGHSGHRWGPGKVRRSSGVFRPHSGAAWAVGDRLHPLRGSEPRHGAPAGDAGPKRGP